MRAEYISNFVGLSYNKLKFSDAKKRWGSCSNQKSINLNWRLIMTPPEVIDYVIVHELVHTVELNHSKRFWEIVSKIIPDFKQSIKWLKENEFLLDI